MTFDPTPPPPPSPDLADDDAANLLQYELSDRIGAFAPYTLASDLLELREIYHGFLARVKDDAWERRSERRPSGWTLRQVFAHLATVAQAYNQVVTALADDLPLPDLGLADRAGLRAWNQAAITARAGRSGATLGEDLCDALGEAGRIAARLTPTQLALPVVTPMYDGVATVAELLGGSAMHAGIVHAAQVALPTRRPPLWLMFSPAMMRRMLTRFFHILGLAYWPERGGDLRATLAFDIIGQGGGSWFVRVSPEGGCGRLGAVRSPDLRLTFASADLFCRIMTVQTPVLSQVLLRRVRVRGSLRLARDFPRLFAPT